MASLQITCTVLSLLSLFLLVAALSADHWLVATSSLGTSYSGLWKVCMNSECGPSVPDYIEVTQHFLLLALMAGFISFFSLVALFFLSHLGFVSLTLVSAMGSFSAGLCASIGLYAYEEEFSNVPPDQGTFGWSYGLSYASCFLFFITGMMTLGI